MWDQCKLLGGSCLSTETDKCRNKLLAGLCLSSCWQVCICDVVGQFMLVGKDRQVYRSHESLLHIVLLWKVKVAIASRADGISGIVTDLHVPTGILMFSMPFMSHGHPDIANDLYVRDKLIGL